MTGSLQIKKGYYYAVLNIADKEGRVHQKWIASGLPIKNNKRRAEEFLRKAISDSEKQHTLFTEKIMFTDYLQEWLAAMKPAVRENTYGNTAQKVPGTAGCDIIALWISR